MSAGPWGYRRWRWRNLRRPRSNLCGRPPEGKHRFSPPFESVGAFTEKASSEALPTQVTEAVSSKQAVEPTSGKAGGQATLTPPSGESSADAGGLLPPGINRAFAAREKRIPETQGRFRVVLGTSRTSLGEKEPAPRQAGETKTSETENLKSLYQPSSPEPVFTETSLEAALGRGRAGETEPWPPVAATSSAAVALQAGEPGRLLPQGSPALAAVQRERFGRVEAVESGVGRDSETGGQVEMLLDEFADRLEEAAGAMGIDLES